jgi:hypothetical protein
VLYQDDCRLRSSELSIGPNDFLSLKEELGLLGHFTPLITMGFIVVFVKARPQLTGVEVEVDQLCYLSEVAAKRTGWILWSQRLLTNEEYEENCKRQLST